MSERKKSVSAALRLRRRIGTRFLCIVAALAIGFSGFVLLRTLSQSHRRTAQLLDRQAELALYFDLAIREYVGRHVRPFAEEHVPAGDFVPEVMSTSYVARKVFERVRDRFPDYVIKFSSDNPRNPVNLATPEEMRIIHYFEEHPEAKHWSGQIELSGSTYQAQFYPRRMTESCLRCHGDPADVPASLLAQYGEQNGFHRKVGSVIALDTVAVPVDAYAATARRQTLMNSIVLIVGLVLLLGAIYWVFHVLVARRLVRIAGHFRQAMEERGDVRIGTVNDTGDDEIGVLARAFNALAVRLNDLYASLENRVSERTAELQEANQDLRKEILERQRAQTALRDNESKYRTLFENSAVGVLLMTDVFVDCNEQACRIWGIPRNEIIGHSPVEFSPEFQPTGRSSKAAAREHLAAAEAGEAEFFIWRHLHRNGSVIDAEISLKTVRVDGQEMILATMRDVTQREQAYREQTARLKRVRKQQKAIVELAGYTVADRADLTEICRRITELAAEAVDVDRTSVWMFDAEGDMLRCVNVFDRRERRQDEGMTLCPDDFPAYFKALEAGHAIDAHDARADSRTSEFTESYLQPLGISSMLDSMVRVRGRVVGVVCLQHRGKPRHWYDDEIAFGRAVADRVSQELLNAERTRAEEELRTSLNDLERLNAAMLGREKRILEMKEQVNVLCEQLGRSHVYDAAAEPDEPTGSGKKEQGCIDTRAVLERMRGLQPLLVGFCNCTGIAAAIIDRHGEVVVGANWQRICTHFHRQNPQSAARCVESDTVIANQLLEGQDVALYTCKNGLTDAATGIFVHGQHVANLFVGQFLLEEPDKDAFGRRSREYGFDEREYLDALAEVPVMDRIYVESLLKFLRTLANFVASMEQNWIEQNAANLELKEGRRAALSMMEDAEAARKRVEESQRALRESEQRMAMVLDSAPAGIVIINRDTHTIEYANPAAARMAGRGVDELTGRQCHELMCPAAKGQCPITDLHQSVDNSERMLLRGDGTKLHILKTARAITLRRQKCLIETFVDISDRKRAEDALQLAKHETEQINLQLQQAIEKANLLAQEAMAANKAKSQFLANMSHEIRTPMNAIVGFSRMLAEESLGREHAEYVDIIIQSAQSLLTLIDDILDVSRAEAGKLKIEITQCRLVDLLGHVESMMRPQIAEKGLDFRIVKSEDAPAVIRTDPARLRQCLINLINNAAKFTENGHIHVRVRPSEVDGVRFVRFEVEDTGIGIEPEKQATIFAPFTQADDSHTRRHGGAGLGLAITGQLSKLLGGRISVASEPGNGSTFTLEIPVGPESSELRILDAEDAVDEPQGEDARRQDCSLSGHVLVAEDTPTNQLIVRKMLERIGLKVTLVDNGQKAVDQVLHGTFDLVLMDVQMPVMDGYAAVGQLRKEHVDIPVIALTANAMDGDRKRCMDAGCTDYLSKPIDKERLTETLATYLSAHDRDSSFADNGDEDALGQDEPGDGCWGIVDYKELIGRALDEEIAAEVMSVSVEDNAGRLADAVAALEANDAAMLAESAHAIKGSSLSVAAIRLSDAAACLEQAARHQNLSDAAALLENVRAEFEALRAYVSDANWLEKAKHAALNAPAIS